MTRVDAPLSAPLRPAGNDIMGDSPPCAARLHADGRSPSPRVRSHSRALASRALTALGRARLAGLEPSPNPVDRAPARADGRSRHVRAAGRIARDSAPEDCPRSSPHSMSKAEPLEPLALLGCRVSPLDRVGGDRPSSAPADPGLAAIGQRAGSFTTERQAVTRAIEPTGDMSDKASPALRDIRDALRRQRASLRASLDALAQRPRHGQVPAGPDRHRPQRPIRARRARPSTATPFRAWCTAARPAARACTSSRSATVGSTTRSSRSSKAKRPKSTGFSRAHGWRSARAGTSSTPRSTWLPNSTSSTRKSTWPAAWTASRRPSRPTGASSSAARAIRC